MKNLSLGCGEARIAGAQMVFLVAGKNLYFWNPLEELLLPREFGCRIRNVSHTLKTP
jgi:hypothetical protein